VATLLQVFKTECGHLAADAALLKRVTTYERQWVNSREENITFFGGNLMGTPRVVFTASDMHRWFDEVLGVDEVILQKEIHKLPSINPEFKVSSDTFNLMCFYLMHLFATSKQLNPQQKEQGCVAVIRVMHYRFITSLMTGSNYFKFEPKRETMEATYAALDNKFSLKQHGSWSKLIDHRAQSILDTRGKRYPSILNFATDEDIVKSLNDIQGRIREVVKKMYSVFLRVHNSNSRIATRSSTINIDGEFHLRDLVRKSSQLQRYAHEVLIDKDTFIRQELIGVIVDLVHTMNERLFVETLQYMVNNHGTGGDKRVGELVDNVMLHALDYINNNRELMRSNTRFAIILVKLKSLYGSPRSTEPLLFDIREQSKVICKKATATTNESMLSSLRTGLMLYIVLRTLAMEFYV
jgi:hypothetical protein